MDNAKNFAKVTVSTTYDASATSIVLTTGHGAKLPTEPFNAVWWNSTDYADPSDDPNVEVVRVTARSTDTLTVTRGQEGISASTKNTAGKTYKMIAGLTAKVINTDLASIPLNAQQGFLINGKLSVSVASNNITVEIKTLAGTNPTTSDPVFCRIGDTVRSITAALSVTKNAGTNWFNAGSSEFATKEIDYFAYLGYNATDGVVIGFARFIASKYGDFSATTTSGRYCAISTITNASSTDYYEVIGRFAATLSATASFNWSVPTFTALNLIQRPVYETRWLDYVPTISGSGGSLGTFATSSLGGRYQVRGNTVYLHNSAVISNKGSWSGTVMMNLPFTATNRTGDEPFAGYVCANNANPATASRGIPNIGGNLTTIQFSKAIDTNTVQWSDLAANDCIRTQGFYEMN